MSFSFFIDSEVEQIVFSITLDDPPRKYTRSIDFSYFSSELKINSDDINDFLEAFIEDNKIMPMYDAKNDNYSVSIINISLRKKPEIIIVLTYKQPTNPEERSLNQALVAVSDLKKQLNIQLVLLQLSNSENNLNTYGHKIGSLDLDLLKDLIDVMTAYKNGLYKHYQKNHIECIVLTTISALFDTPLTHYSPDALLLQDDGNYSTSNAIAKYDNQYIHQSVRSPYKDFMLDNVLDEKNKPLIKQIFLLFVEVFNNINYKRAPLGQEYTLLNSFIPSLFDNIMIKPSTRQQGVGDIINTKKIERVNFIFNIIEEKQIEFVMNTSGINSINIKKGENYYASIERSKLFLRYNTIVKYLTIVV
jgi:hypothetical protein